MCLFGGRRKDFECRRGPETKAQDREGLLSGPIWQHPAYFNWPHVQLCSYNTLQATPQPPAHRRALHPTAASPDPSMAPRGTLPFRRAAGQRLPPSLLGRPPPCTAPCPERTMAGLPKTRAPPKVLQGPPGSLDIHRHHEGGGARAEVHDEPGQQPHGGTGGRGETNRAETSQIEPK